MKNLVDSIKKRRGAATEVAGAWGSSNCFFIDHRAVGLDREFTNPSTRGVFECAKQAPIDFFDADVAGIGRQHEADFAGLPSSNLFWITRISDPGKMGSSEPQGSRSVGALTMVGYCKLLSMTVLQKFQPNNIITYY